jgi:hypothetical protein
MPRNRQSQAVIEENTQLIDEYASDPLYSLEEVSTDSLYYLEKEAPEKRQSAVLTGPEAMTFIGIEPRPLNALRQGDYGRIQERFERLFQRWAKIAKNEGRTIDAQSALWKNIKIRVWNRKNIAELSIYKIVGKQVAGCPTLGVEGGEYTGDLMDGRALSTFLSEVKNSTRHKEVLVQLESVTVTEDMRNA